MVLLLALLLARFCGELTAASVAGRRCLWYSRNGQRGSCWSSPLHAHLKVVGSEHRQHCVVERAKDTTDADCHCADRGCLAWRCTSSMEDLWPHLGWTTLGVETPVQSLRPCGSSGVEAAHVRIASGRAIVRPLVADHGIRRGQSGEWIFWNAEVDC